MQVEKYSNSLFRNGHIYGMGTLHEIKDLGRKKTPEEIIKEARDAGWSDGCPVAQRLTSPSSPYDPEWMLQRYTEVNRWFTYLCMEADKLNPTLGWWLKKSISRLMGEPVGEHEPASVPFLHLTQIFPMDTPCGYASPRLPIEIIKLGKNKMATTEQAYLLMVDTIREARTPRQLLARLSERVVLAGVDPVHVLQHTLAAGTLKEESCFTECRKLVQCLEIDAPTVMNVYARLNQHERADLEIAEIPYP